MKADGKPRRMIIRGKNKIELEDILIGEVWLGSGQSNMQMPMKETGAKEAITTARHANIRPLYTPCQKTHHLEPRCPPQSTSCSTIQR